MARPTHDSARPMQELYGGGAPSARGRGKGRGRGRPSTREAPVVRQEPTPTGRRTKHIIQGLEITSPGGTVTVQPLGPSAPALTEEECGKLREEFYITSPLGGLDADADKKQKANHAVRASKAKKRLYDGPQAVRASKAKAEADRREQRDEAQKKAENNANNEQQKAARSKKRADGEARITKITVSSRT